MKKSSFVALLMGTISGVLFALGMCMALLPEWDAFREGVIFGGRLGMYRYFDMHHVVKEALTCARRELG